MAAYPQGTLLSCSFATAFGLAALGPGGSGCSDTHSAAPAPQEGVVVPLPLAAATRPPVLSLALAPGQELKEV